MWPFTFYVLTIRGFRSDFVWFLLRLHVVFVHVHVIGQSVSPDAQLSHSILDFCASRIVVS